MSRTSYSAMADERRASKFRNGDRVGKSTTGAKTPMHTVSKYMHTDTLTHTHASSGPSLYERISLFSLSLSLSPHTCMGAFAPGARWSCARRTGPSRVYCIPPRTPFRALA